MKLNLKIWRQEDAQDKGGFQKYTVDGIDGDMSFLEMLDVLNNTLVEEGWILSNLTMTVERESVDRVHSKLMENLMDRIDVLLPVNST